MTSCKLVTFYFDVISPYNYFGFEGITRHRGVWKTPVALKPFFFAGVLRASKNETVPLKVPIKEQYLHKDVVFNAQYWGLPFRLPKDLTNTMLTTSSIVPQRVLVACQLESEALMEDVAKHLWRRYFAYGKSAYTERDVEEVLRDRRVANVDDIMKASKSDEVKSILRRNTDEAIAQGCFGAPWTHITDGDGKVLQAVFGADRLPQIADFIDEKFHGPMREKADRHL
ncbi:unnamed protein product [Caenorhabditis bovis]|uniref:Glutathione S-transferase kappa n=1 Tax=Caenorhabditis bovis TaxID=2654633 RepID=A0A8S1EYR2_9PELO|nr:unnamed protein product [Caenorhabditis bovis]